MMTTNKKKSAPGGTPVCEQDYSTTPGRESEAEMLFGMISTWDRPVRRPKNSGTDRALRKLIEKANNSGDCIINNGSGYYRPSADNEIDEYGFHLYKSKELARARAITNKIKAMENAFYGRY